MEGLLMVTMGGNLKTDSWFKIDFGELCQAIDLCFNCVMAQLQ